VGGVEIKRSEFDSNLLSREVGKLSLASLTPEVLTEVISDFREGSLDLVMLKSPFIPLHVIAGLALDGPDYKLSLSDIKLDLCRGSKEPHSAGAGLGNYSFSTDTTLKDLESIQLIARQIGRVSRFADEFGESVADSLYDQWVSNLLSKETIYVAREAASSVSAVVATTKSEASVDLALVSAHPSHSGKGVTKALVNFATAELLKETPLVTVSARINNIPAVKLYESAGFRSYGVRMDWTLTKKK